MMLLRYLLCCALLVLAGCELPADTATAGRVPAAACAAEALPEHIVQAMQEGRHMAACFVPYLVTLDQGTAVQAQVVALLARERERAGYKLAAAGRKTQERLAIHSPLTGVLFRDMLLPSGASIPATAGAELFYEADLLAEVGDDFINEAHTLQDAARSLRRITAFLEVPDLMLPKGAPNNGPQLLAINTAAHLGVTGDSMAVRDDAAFIVALAAMQLTLRNGAGEVLAEAVGAQLLGNPLQAVLHLRDEVRRRGEQLRPGDLLSLGTFTGLRPVQAGKQVTVTYSIPGEGVLQVQATFE